MGLALLFVIWIITLVSSYFFVAQTWWLHPGASAHAAALDHQFAVTYFWMGIVFVAAQMGLGFFVWKYRDRERAPAVAYSHGNTKMEIMWTGLTAVLFIALNLTGHSVWAESRFREPAADAVKVEVTALQFAWYFRYPGPDGKFGPVKPELIDASIGNAVGLDEEHPDSKDDIVVGSMIVPVDREIEIILRAQDVLHSFFIPAMRVKQDAVPGLMIRQHFRPVKTGEYEFTCTELCGLGHYKMNGRVRVVSQEDFQKWQAERQAEKAQ